MTDKSTHGEKTEKIEKSEKTEKREFLPEKAFRLSDVLPDAAGAYFAEIRDINDAVKDADVVLDTNVLLIPYGAGSGSLTAITDIYESLRKSKRLYIPAQVIREFI